MKKNFVKKLALGLALVMAVTSVPATSEAAAKPSFKSTKVTVKEGQTKKYNTVNAKKYSVKFKIGNKSVATIKYTPGSKAVKVTGVAEGKTTLRADFKSYKTKKVTTVKIPVTVKALNPAIKSATATSSKTIVLSGIKVNTFVKEDVTVAGYNVTDFVTTETNATITLDRALIPNTEVKVTVKGAEFTVKYVEKVVNGVAVVEATYDNDWSNQYVAFTVDGRTVAISDLVNNGYSFTFNVLDKDDAIVTDLLDSTTGKLNVPLTSKLNADDSPVTYKVQLLLSNGTTVLESAWTEITIADLDQGASTISAYTLQNDTNTNVAVPQLSTTLVIDEQATFTGVTLVMDGVKAPVTGGFGVKSSDSSVISVATDSKTITAHKPGTAVITLSYGTVKKDVTFTVAKADRVVTKAGFDKTTTKATIFSAPTVGSTSVNVYLYDQYGDKLAKVPAYDDVEVIVKSSKPELFTVPTTAIATNDGTDVTSGAAVTLTAAKADINGTASLYVQKKDVNTLDTDARTIATLPVKVTTNYNASHSVWSFAAGSASADYTLDLAADSTAEMTWVKLNTENDPVGVKSVASGYTAKSSNDTVATADPSTGNLVITGHKAGTATITLIDDATQKVVFNKVFKVESNRVALKSIALKNPATMITPGTVDYKTFMTVILSEDNDILSGVTLSKAFDSKVRVTEDGIIYLDRNHNGVEDSASNTTIFPADIVLGYYKLVKTTNSEDITINAVNGNDVNATIVAGSTGTVQIRIYDVDDKYITGAEVAVKVGDAN